jgi:hypothetical protein
MGLRDICEAPPGAASQARYKTQIYEIFTGLNHILIHRFPAVLPSWMRDDKLAVIGSENGQTILGSLVSYPVSYHAEPDETRKDPATA